MSRRERLRLAPNGPELGIDVELQRPLADLDKMAARAHGARAGRVSGARRCRSAACLFQAWTGKEALAKAGGEGLSRAFEHFELIVAPLTAPRIHAMGGRRRRGGALAPAVARTASWLPGRACGAGAGGHSAPVPAGPGPAR